MGDKWREMIFDDCAELVRDTCQPEEAFGKPYIGLEHIEQGTLRLSEIGMAEDVSSTKSKFKSGDILFGKLRPYFRKVVRAKFDGICSTDIWVVRSKKDIDQGFLFYLMASKEFVDIANQGSEGTKMPRAKWDFVTKIKQEVPPLPEQKAIASILGALDDKIELNRKMNETLEAMARAIFKSCFTYPFEGIKGMPSPDLAGHPLPVGEGRGEGELELVDSPLGKIPKGWMVGTIADISQLNRDVINPTDFPAETFQHYSIPAYDEGQMPTHDLGATVMSNKFLLPNNCILISKLNPRIPRIWFPKINKSYRSIASTEFLVLTPKAPYTSEFIYSLCTSSVFQDAFVSLVTGTSSSHQRVKPDDFLTIKTVCPSDIVLQKFAAKTEPLFARVQSNDEQSRTLATIRDTLLPKLLSGEIRVKEAEGFLEKA